ncbi:MAG TPA: hypothetical protein VFZ09_42120 [Archangium sp.]|uniref:hypothetical protein n=1 Tax=Archangium sp. TaxID=1872627 RepID=UPI002E3137FC|nr:hypothetical protein [Archangium sp.]HEX5752875.1 hypothetical protein [Archangium sp.]
MQRLREAPPAASEREAEPLASPPALEPVPVRERLELLRLSGVPAGEVERLLLALSGVLAWVTAFCLHPREEPPEA